MTMAKSGKSEIERLLPGHMAIVESDRIRKTRFWSPDAMLTKARITDQRIALKIYGEAITEAVRKRVAGRDRVGIIFSGGVDSLLIAYLIRKLGVPFTCYTAGHGDEASDLGWAIRLAEQLGFPLQYKKLSKEAIGELVPEIIRDIEDHSLNQVEVAVPIYASVRLAQEAGERVILSGQGADELFGGYSWYPAVVDQEGYETFERRSFDDAFLLYKECLEREDKIAMAHSMELRVPFLDPKVIELAFRISPELKVNRGGDALGKRIHREYCESIGIPREVAYRKKEAAQHGANVHVVFEALAKDAGSSEELLNDTGYNPDKSVTEKLGSSSRYGYKYGDAHLWKPLSSVQYYLDSAAAGVGMLSEQAEQQWREVKGRIAAGSN
jgi:asparagine synthase (glutamine-hydrolysing)